ncbi:MAG: ECF transporter S component [Ruminococcus sp.]|nr:ECF transporter S component [Ruminococcus sp.]
MNTKVDTKKLALMGLLTALVVVLTYFNIPIPIVALSLSMAMIPVAIAAIALGPIGGAVIGAVWGVCSFLQCFGILGLSGMGAFTVEISPVLTFLQRFVPRVLEGFCAGWIFRIMSKLTHPKISCFITGFSTALMNTIFFMGALVILFGNNQEFVDKYMGNQSPIAWIVTSITVNAVPEMIASTIVAGAVGFALCQAKFISVNVKEKNSETASAA